jgi:hypothetical protein
MFSWYMLEIMHVYHKFNMQQINNENHAKFIS